MAQFYAGSTPPGPTFYGDTQVNETYPGIQLAPQETAGVWAEWREISGYVWFARNARYNPGAGWTQVNSALPSNALVLDNTGNLLYYYAASGVSGFITWVQATGISTVGSLFTNGGYVPPVYTNTGAITAMTEHSVRGTASCAVASGQFYSTVLTISLAGLADFSSTTSYQVALTINYTLTTLPASWALVMCPMVTTKTTASFGIIVANTVLSTGTGTIVVDWIAKGQ